MTKWYSLEPCVVVSAHNLFFYHTCRDPETFYLINVISELSKTFQ